MSNTERSPKKYQVAVIGYGWAATAHIEALNACENAEVTAVYSSRELNEDELREKYGSPIRTFNDLDALMRDSSINVVSVTGYPFLHAEHAIAAAKAGKHLIIEKPLALTMEDVYTIQDAVNAAGVKACICFEARWAGQLQSTRKIVEAGLIGRIHYGEVDYYHGIGPWGRQWRWNTKSDGGGSSLLSAGCHAMDALRHCMEGEITSVYSQSTKSSSETFSAYEYDTTSVTILTFADGRIGKVASVIDCLQPYYFHVHLVGSEGSLLDNKIYSQQMGTDKSRWSELSMKMLDSGDVHDHPYQTEFEAFFAALDEGKDVAYTNLAEAVKSHECIFAAEKSLKEGRPVAISEVRRE